MKKYLVIYLRNKRIQNVFVVPEARDSKQAKQIVDVYHPAAEASKVSAISLDGITRALWSYS